MKDGSICSKCNHRAYCAMGDEHNNDNATIKGCYLYSEQKAKTNADRIRAMTNEELAVFLGNTKAFCCRDRDPSEEFIAEFKTWLKEEAEE